MWYLEGLGAKNQSSALSSLKFKNSRKNRKIRKNEILLGQLILKAQRKRKCASCKGILKSVVGEEGRHKGRNKRSCKILKSTSKWPVGTVQTT